MGRVLLRLRLFLNHHIYLAGVGRFVAFLLEKGEGQPESFVCVSEIFLSPQQHSYRQCGQNGQNQRDPLQPVCGGPFSVVGLIVKFCAPHPRPPLQASNASFILSALPVFNPGRSMFSDMFSERCVRPSGQPMTIPPSTGRTWPVMNPAAGEARK